MGLIAISGIMAGIAVLSVTWAALPFAMLISFMGLKIHQTTNNE